MRCISRYALRCDVLTNIVSHLSASSSSSSSSSSLLMVDKPQPVQIVVGRKIEIDKIKIHTCKSQ